MYAGFIRRSAASFIDAIVMFIVMFILAIPLTLLLPESLAKLILSIFGFVYCAYFESSSWQATPGKKCVGIKVTDLQGNRVSFWRALGRNVAKWLSNITFFIGYLMCIWTKKRQCLHDMVTGCLVVSNEPSPTGDPRPTNPPFWVWLVGLVAPLLGFILMLGLVAAIALPQYLFSVEKIRAAESYKLMGEIAYSAERHLLETGQWPQNFGQLDIQVQGTFIDNQKRTFKANQFLFSAQGQYPQPFVIKAQRANDETPTQGMFAYTLVTVMNREGKLSRTCEPQDNEICKAIIQRLQQK